MVREAKIKRNYEFAPRPGGGEILSVKVYSTFTRYFGHLIIGALTIFSIVTLFIGLIVAIPLGFLLFRRTTKKVEFAPEGVIANGKLYRYANINQVGSDDYMSGIVADQRSNQAFHMAFSGQIIVRHGTERVPIISGLPPKEVDALYDDVRAAFERAGNQFT